MCGRIVASDTGVGLMNGWNIFKEGVMAAILIPTAIAAVFCVLIVAALAAAIAANAIIILR